MIVVEITKDVELMREALKALKSQMLRGRWSLGYPARTQTEGGHTQSCLGRSGKGCSLRCQQVASTITKLEERLLQE